MLGSSQHLLNRDHTATYYSDMPSDAATGRLLRRHGDEVQRLAGGYYRALGRCDDTMNLGGIKVGGLDAVLGGCWVECEGVDVCVCVCVCGRRGRQQWERVVVCFAA